MPKQIIISPEHEIGKEFWFMYNNEVRHGLIAAYHVYVTSATNENMGWSEQLWNRFWQGKHKEVFKYSYSYEAKVAGEITMSRIYEKKDGWEVWGKKIFFSKEELLNSL